jgi:hypothetical protein
VPGADETHDQPLAPIDYFVVEFPAGRVTAGGFDRLLRRVEAGDIAILDLEFVAADASGAVRVIGLDDVPTADDTDLSVWAGASSGLLDAEDLEVLTQTLSPGSLGVVAVVENLWVLGVVNSWGDGARLVADGGLSVTDVEQALDAAEAEEA